jgi:hypothetical protein
MNWIYQRGIHLPADLVLVVPISVSFDIDADTHTYNWALFTDRSHAKGTENYVDVYVSSEVGFKFPLSKIVSFDIKSGAKIGEKHYKRDEVRQSSRVGETTSRAYIIRKIGRNCLLYSRGLINMGVVNLFSLQTGYRLEQKDSGNVLGSWWNAFDLGANQVESGYFEAGTAMERAVDVYSLEMAKRRTNWPSR